MCLTALLLEIWANCVFTSHFHVGSTVIVVLDCRQCRNRHSPGAFANALLFEDTQCTARTHAHTHTHTHTHTRTHTHAHTHTHHALQSGPQAEMMNLLENEDLARTPIIVLANKQDLKDAMQVGEAQRRNSLKCFAKRLSSLKDAMHVGLLHLRMLCRWV